MVTWTCGRRSQQWADRDLALLHVTEEFVHLDHYCFRTRLPASGRPRYTGDAWNGERALLRSRDALLRENSLAATSYATVLPYTCASGADVALGIVRFSYDT